MIRISVLICLGGCAFGVKGPDPFRSALTPPQCDTTKGLVVVDAVVAAAAGVTGLALAANNQGGAGYPLLLTGALYSASAWSGNSKVDACRQAFQSYEVAMTNAARESPPALAAAPPALAAPPPSLAAAPPVAAPPAQAGPSLAMRAHATAAKPVETRAEPAPEPAAPAKPIVPADDAFHVAVGAPPPVRPVKPKPNPSKPASDDVWSHFWREVP